MSAHSISLSTAKPYYCAGDSVSGYINVQLNKRTRLNEIYLKVKGCETVSWKEFKDNGKRAQRFPAGPATGGSFLNTQSVSQSITERTGSAIIFSEEYPVYRFTSEILEPGTYNFPFTFQLPLNAGCTLSGRLNDGRTPVAFKGASWDVKYTIKAVLNGCGKSRCITDLTLNDRMPLTVEPTKIVQEALKGRGLCSAGDIPVNVELSSDRNVVESGKTLRVSALTEEAGRRVTLTRNVTLKCKSGACISERQVLAVADLEPVDEFDNVSDQLATPDRCDDDCSLTEIDLQDETMTVRRTLQPIIERNVQSSAEIEVPANADCSHNGSLISVTYLLELSSVSAADVPCVLPVKVCNTQISRS